MRPRPSLGNLLYKRLSLVGSAQMIFIAHVRYM